jgi:hypothetical protein
MFEDMFVLQAANVPHVYHRDQKLGPVLSSICLKTSAYHHLICIIFSQAISLRFVCIKAVKEVSGAGIMEAFERNLKPTNVKDYSGSK